MMAHDPVSARVEDGLCIIETNNPPLNVLSAAVRRGLVRELSAAEANPDVRAILLICKGKTAFSGADITEFAGEIAQPDLPVVLRAVAQSSKPVTMAMHGRVLGGGFELALAAQARIAGPGTRAGLPEVKLGLAPGGGGIERVVEIAGVEAALDLCVSGREVGAGELLALGLVDAIAGDDLAAEAAAFARNLAPSRTAHADPQAEAKVEAFREANAGRLRGQDAPREIIGVIAMLARDPDSARDNPGEAAFHRLASGSQSQALRHLFAAERKVRDLSFLPVGTEPLPVAEIGIVGAGTMGSGIATALLTGGYRVTLHDSSAVALERAAGMIGNNLAGAVHRGKMTEDSRSEALTRLTTADDVAALGTADLIIEAVYEDMKVKRDVFARLDGVARTGAILATNTSFLDIDEIASATSRPDHVLGMHFFSPAHVMRLLEVVRGARTAPEVIATAMAIGQKAGKTAVCVGNCHGFVGNRLLLQRQNAAMELLLDGVSPYDIDSAMVDFGLPMGPFAMADLAGLDVGWDREGTAGRTVEEVMCEAGRLGRKNGKGYYDYDEAGRAGPSPVSLALIADFRKRTGRTETVDMAAPEILDRLLQPMLSEVGRIIDEGIVIRPSDIDVIWVHGYGWPRWRGGPSWWRDQAGVGAAGAGSPVR